MLKNRFVLVFVGILIGGLLAYPIFRSIDKSNHKKLSKALNPTSLRQTNSGYTFIKPLLDTEYNYKDEGVKFYPYEQAIEDNVTAKIKSYPNTKIGFYFNDLSNLSWVGVNESEKFIPASLLKIPMLIAYYKLNEIDRSIFDQKITYTGTDLDKSKNLGVNGGIAPGNTYTVEQLLHEMVLNSDNNALELLYQYKVNALKNIFADLQTPFPEDREAIALTDYLSTQQQSRFLLVLYNASYLSRANSEEVLKLLTQTNFNDGLVAGLPSNTLISHKFGERIVTNPDNSTYQEFHDCGIIYLPTRPYELCIMTKGSDLKAQEKIVQEISAIVYKNVSAVRTGLR